MHKFLEKKNQKEFISSKKPHGNVGCALTDVQFSLCSKTALIRGACGFLVFFVHVLLVDQLAVLDQLVAIE